MALVIVVMAALAVALGGRSDKADHQAQSAGANAGSGSKDKRKTGGPFLDPIPARPVSLWTDQASDVVGGQSASVSVASANESTVLLSGFDGHDHSLLAVEAGTGKKKWQAPAPFGESLTSCDLAGDGSALCQTEFASDSSLDTSLSETIRLAFFGADGVLAKTVELPKQRWATTYPLRDGFVIQQWGGTVDLPVFFATDFSNTGDQRWTAQGPPGQSSFNLSAAAGLFVLGSPFSAQVYSLDTGQPVGRYPESGDGSEASAKNVWVALTATGFAFATEKQVDVFNAQGKKVNQIAGWSLPHVVMKPSSKQCGQIMLKNKDGAVAAADAASGQILWQSQEPGGSDPATSDLGKVSCVGSYMLSQQQGAKSVDIYELDTGKKTGSFAVDSDLWSVVGTDGSIVLTSVVSAGSTAYTAYDLATGKQAWASPRSENGQYLFCAAGGKTLTDGSLIGGGLYYLVRGLGGSITRLGQKP